MKALWHRKALDIVDESLSSSELCSVQTSNNEKTNSKRSIGHDSLFSTENHERSPAGSIAKKRYFGPSRLFHLKMTSHPGVEMQDKQEKLVKQSRGRTAIYPSAVSIAAVVENKDVLAGAAGAANDEEGSNGPKSHFATTAERSIEDQISSLTKRERRCLDSLKSKWELRHPDIPFSDSMYLQFARCSPGPKKFQFDASWNVMKNFDHHYLSLTAEELEDQLQTKTLFPLPGLRTIQGHDVFYMRPRRFFPHRSPTQDIIDNLAYCMQTMCEKETNSVHGIGFLAYMRGWTMENFSLQYCYQFMCTLQGHTIPVNVEYFFIVDPPSWFGNVWQIMKPMLSRDFRRKVFMIKERDLHQYLESGFERYLPDEMTQGKAETQALVNDFITYRKRLEG